MVAVIWRYRYLADCTVFLHCNLPVSTNRVALIPFAFFVYSLPINFVDQPACLLHPL